MSSSSSPEPTPAFSPSKSEVSAGTSEPWTPLPLCGASPREPRNCTLLAIISTAWRLPLPSCASHSRQSRRPSTATGRPLDRYVAQFSPCAPHTVTSKKFGLSTQSPLDESLRRLFTATRSLHTEVPFGVVRSSGSLVRFPVTTTTFTFVAATRSVPSQLLESVPD